MAHLKWKNTSTAVVATSSMRTEGLIREAEKITGIHSSRLRIYAERDGALIQLQRQEAISSFKTEEFVIVDSGPQLGFKAENLLEYIPPIFVWPLLVWLLGAALTEYIQVTTIMWMLHYTKRAFETAFVHIYSQASVPIWSLKDNSSVKNCAYYWGFTVAMAVSVVIASRSDRGNTSRLQELGMEIFVVSEILNGYCHLALRKLRPKGSLAQIPLQRDNLP
jgi:very-long-chain enoyl-CoA reductase